MATNDIRLEPDRLAAHAAALFVAAGLGDEHARIAADALVAADLRGVDTHGIVRLPAYLNALLKGVINPRPVFRFERARQAVLVGSADNGLGTVAASVAMDEAVELARTTGIAIVAMRDSNHTGMLAFHATRAARAGMVGYLTSNGPAVMAPRSGTRPVLSNNPFAYAFPRRDAPAIVIDMACSAVARGKIRFAAVRGEELPPGLATDATGTMTTDAVAAMGGSVLPMGGHKGYAIALANELLAAALPGAAFSFQVPTAFLAHGADTMDAWGIGHVCIALDISAFLAPDDYFARVEQLLEQLRGSTMDPTERVVVPGEPEAAAEREHRTHGVPVSASVVQEIDRLAEGLGQPRLAERAAA